jgi:serine/threonine protein kinase
MSIDASKLMELVVTAFQMPIADRGAYLTRECGGDHELRSQVEALLGALAASVGATPDPATGAYAPAPEDDAGTGQYLAAMAMVIAGRYVLEKMIGEGGMGEVWIAKQTEPVKRNVAIKLIKSGMDSKAVLARFEQERQALAMMDHPNIARVLDGGMTHEPGTGRGASASGPGRPFFVMELVNGLPLNRFCDDMKLTPRQRLELFVPICQAVQHAHQKGIIHRDLKPSNILVTLIDGRPVPKVIDFGVAKAISGRITDTPMDTQFGAVIGTFEYMAPEQAGFAGHDVDTRADVYSLGVILYELLTGLRPHDAKRLRKAALNEVIRVIQEVEPSKPSTRLSTDEALPSVAATRQIEPRRLMAMLRGELDWVVMKCLEKQRERRYETANALARDVQRYLANEAVEARPPSTGYRLSKFLRRNRGPVIAAVLLLISLLGGMVGTFWGLLQARWQTTRAIQAADDKEVARANEAEQRALAEQAHKQAYEALRSFTDEVMGKVLGGRTQLTDNEKAILRSAQKQWEVFAQSKGNSAEARAIRADGAENLALVQRTLGMYPDVEANHRLALELRTSLAAEHPDVERYRATAARSHQNLGSALRENGKTLQAEDQFRHAVEAFEKLCGEFPNNAEYRRRMADSLVSLGNSMRDQGKWEATEREYRRALAIQEKLAADAPDKIEYQHAVARSHWALAFVKRRVNQFAESEAHYRLALATYQALVQREPAKLDYRRDQGSLHRELGAMLSDNKKPDLGVKEFPPAIDILGKLVAEFPSVPVYRNELARCHRDFGRVQAMLKNRDEARRQLQLAETMFERLIEANPAALPYQADIGLTLCFRGELEADTVTPEKGLVDFDKAIQVLTSAHVRDAKHILIRNSLAKAHAARAALLNKLSRHAEAIRNWDAAVELAPPDRLREYRVQRAESNVRSGRLDAAIAEADALNMEPCDNAEQWFSLARLFALIGGKRPDYVDPALTMLRQAVTAGFKDSARLTVNADFDALRRHDDFKKLLAELETRKNE